MERDEHIVKYLKWAIDAYEEGEVYQSWEWVSMAINRLIKQIDDNKKAQ